MVPLELPDALLMKKMRLTSKMVFAMKKIVKPFLFLAAFALALASCQKEADKPVGEKTDPAVGRTVVLTINAENPLSDLDTKTVISGTTPSWANGDKVTVIYTNTSAEVVTASSSALNENASTASFTVALTSPDDSEPAYAYFPGNSKSATASTATLVIDNEQLPTGTSFDGASDILVSKAFTPAGTVEAQFKRLGAVLKIKVSHASINSEKLVRLSVTGENPLAGDVEVNLGDGTINDISGSNTVMATYDDANQFKVNAEGKYVYLIVCPQTLAKDSHLVIEGATTGHTFSKDITLNKDIVLKSGHIQPLNITITTAPLDVDYVTLDWEWEGGTKTELTANAGVSQNGLGSDYAESNAPYRCKVDTDGDYVQIKTNASISSVVFGYKVFEKDKTIYVDVKESADGSSWNKVQSLSYTSTKANDTGTLATSSSFNSDSRYIRIERGAGSYNFGLGPISVLKNDSRTTAGISWKKSGSSTDEDVATLATGPDTYPTIELDNPNGLPVSFTSSDPTVAIVKASTSETTLAKGAVLTLVGGGTTDITASFAGSKTYKPASVKYTLTVTDNRSTVATPSITITDNEVTITCDTVGASIYYTTNGDTPTTSSTPYSSTFSVAENATVKAIATKEDYKTSAVVSRKNSTAATLTCDFENTESSYTSIWTFSSYNNSNTTITAHGGSKYGDTNSATSWNVRTKNKISSPQSITFYVSKVSNNTATTTWKVQYSTNGSTWNDVGDGQSAVSMDKGVWEEVTRSLSSYSNCYIRIIYNGGSSTATRTIDDISLSYIE